MGVRDYRELHAWQMARALADGIAGLALSGDGRPTRLAEQINSAAQSVCANIAEGFGRYGPGDFSRFLKIARGSAMEVQQHLHTAERANLLSADQARELHTLTRRVIGSIVPLIKYLESQR